MDQLPRLGKRELICLLLFTCNYVVSVWRCILFLWVLGMGYVILLWLSLSHPYNYDMNIFCEFRRRCRQTSDTHMSCVMRKPAFCLSENKYADQLCGTRIVQPLFLLNTKFQASSHLLWLHSPVCAGPGRKFRRQVFSRRGSNHVSFSVLQTC